MNRLCTGVILLLTLLWHSPSVIAQGLPLPSFENFDNGPAGWTASQFFDSTAWEYGFPQFGSTTGAHSGLSCWDVNLTTGYQSSGYCTLTSPAYNISGLAAVDMSFWMNYNSESGWDGVRMEYSFDNMSWFILGSYLDPSGVNWYNTSNLQSSNIVGWSGTSPGWIKCAHRIQSFNYDSVQFRFIFTSDPQVNRDGFSVDDFSVNLIPDTDAGICSIYGPTGIQSAVPIYPGICLNNAGGNSITITSVSYRLDNNPPVTENPNLLIPASGSSSYTFASAFVPSTGAHTITVWTSVSGDTIQTNDTMSAQFSVPGLINVPYTDDFENGDMGWSTATVNPTTVWEMGYPVFGQTTGTYSGSTAWDINLLYGYGDDASAQLFTPYLDVTSSGIYIFSFMQNRNSEDGWDGLRIDYDDGSGFWQILGSVNDSNATNWYTNPALNSSSLPGWDSTSSGWINSVYKMNINTPSVYRFAFTFTSDASISTDGVTIDDFSFTKMADYDAALVSVTPLSALPIQGNQFMSDVIIKNNGGTILTSAQLYASYNQGAPVNFSFSGSLPYGASASVSLPSFTINAGVNTVTVYVIYPGDANQLNDTVNYSFTALGTSAVPYTTDFDNGNQGWINTSTGISGSNWELGFPSYGNTSSTHSGGDCWDVNLASPYGNVARCYLYSPVFSIAQNNDVQLSFWLNYDTEPNHDGLQVEYNVGSGWELFGEQNDPNGVNWYNSNLASVNAAGWSGNSFGWQHVSLHSSQFTGIPGVQFRFAFSSDIILSGTGVSMDDFSISMTTGMNELADASLLTVRPNPTSDIIKIDHINLAGEYSLRIFDQSGRCVKSNSASEDHLELNVSDLAAGCYYIELANSFLIQRTVFIKQ